MNHRMLYLLLAHAALIKAFRPPARRLHQGLALCAAADADVNSLMTQLNAAVQQEDFRKAAELKKQLDALRGDDGGSNNKRGDWASRGAPGWLQARLQDLGMRFPTSPRSGPGRRRRLDRRRRLGADWKRQDVGLSRTSPRGARQ
jgi:hypothetical protein